LVDDTEASSKIVSSSLTATGVSFISKTFIVNSLENDNSPSSSAIILMLRVSNS